MIVKQDCNYVSCAAKILCKLDEILLKILASVLLAQFEIVAKTYNWSKKSVRNQTLCLPVIKYQSHKCEHAVDSKNEPDNFRSCTTWESCYKCCSCAADWIIFENR